MKKIKLVLLAMLLAPAAAFATTIGDGVTLGTGDPSTPYLVDLSFNSQTIYADANEGIYNYWRLNATQTGTYHLTFASTTLDLLNVKIDNFTVDPVGSSLPASPTGMFTVTTPGTYDFMVTGTAGTGFSNGQATIGGIYTVTTDFAPVPVPAAIWFMGTALFGMLASARRK